jgi:acyl carrier protein
MAWGLGKQDELESAGDGRPDKRWQTRNRGKGAHVETIINEYISQELVRDPALLPLADDTPLLKSGILDSLSLLRLVIFVEERFGVTMGDDADLLSENFASVNTICARLRALEAAK